MRHQSVASTMVYTAVDGCWRWSSPA